MKNSLQWHRPSGPWILSTCFLAGAAFSWNPPVKADSFVVPDNTLGAENSVVNELDGLTQIVEGGAIRESNLFHNFLEFNVADSHAVYFANPVTVESILTRVTGDNPSTILGRLGVLGDADLFLLNPNGIVFGEGDFPLPLTIFPYRMVPH